MARRELQEINAGSMADIAFLLLIFFLVTTTMEVDAGISRTLPLKNNNPDPPEAIDIRNRDILEIYANSNDQLLVEGKITELDELEPIVRDYYTANINGETNPDMPDYKRVTIPICQKQIAKLEKSVSSNKQNVYAKGELEKWKTKLQLCRQMPSKEYAEIAKMAVIRLKNQAGTSYGLYIQVQNILKKVVNELRVKQCEAIWNRSYFALKSTDPEDQDIIKKLRILVPERIIEAKIER